MTLISKPAKGKLILLVALALCLCGQAVYAQSGLVQIADNVYCYADVKPMSSQTSFAANAGVIVGRDSIAVIDTLSSAKEGQRLLNDIRAISDKPVKYIITTHYHADHVLGSSALVENRPEVIAHNADSINLAKAGPTMVDYVQKSWGLSTEDLAGTTVIYPTISFSDKLQLDLGGQKLELIYPGPSHTAGSLLVYLPDQKILFAGDILFTGYHPYIGDGNIPGWLKTLDLIQSMDITQIVPGHGPISSKKDVSAMKDYLTLFDKKATELCAKSGDLEYIYAELKKVLPHRGGELLIKGSVAQKYLRH